MDKLKTGVKRQKNACLTSALIIGFGVIFWMPRCDTPTAQYEINIELLIVKVVAVIPLYYSYNYSYNYIYNYTYSIIIVCQRDSLPLSVCES